MGILKAETVSVTTTGSAGSATGNTDSNPFVGEIVGVYLDWHGSAPATSDVTITDKQTGVEVASEDNSVADKYLVPGIFSEDKDGVALASDVTPQKYNVAQGVNVAVSGSDALTGALVATIFYRK